MDYDAAGIRTLNFNVEVQDPLGQQHSDTANVIINVYDINDNAPSFINPPAEVEIAENANIGAEVIANLAAEDIDSGENATFS